MFGIETTEMFILFVVALLLFGKRLPEVARTVGKGVADFRKGLTGIDADVRGQFYGGYNNTPSTTSQYTPPASRPAPLEERKVPAVPKFEPPKFEPPKIEAAKFEPPPLDANDAGPVV
ncbi:MAG: twin-arginine translocase TatA/TatE family subunit [Planctomycetaceae bacterium]